MTGTHQGEARAVARTRGPPATVDTLTRDLRDLGLAEGSTVLVHASLSALGWVVGGPEAVILALERALGPRGTLMMPAYSMNAPDPSHWVDPPVPESWWATIEDAWPPFDPQRSPPRRLGTIAETFWGQIETERSDHPNDSFCARGPNSHRLLAAHRLDSSLGDGSPLGRLYELDGQVLLLGVDHTSNSSLHLAEYRATWPGKRASPPRNARVVRDGAVVELTLQDLELNSDDFGALGRDLERETTAVRLGAVGAGTARRMPQRAAVDFAVRWIEGHRR